MSELLQQLESIRWSTALFWGIAASVLMFVGSIVVARQIILRMPVDFLVRDPSSITNAPSRGLIKHGVLWFIRNIAGWMLLGAGFIMLFVPGQGILCMFLGLTLISFPGKQTLIRNVMSRPKILNAINRIRAKGNQPALEMPSRSNP